MDPDVKFELKQIDRSVAHLWWTLGLVVAVCVGLALWNVVLVDQTHRVEERLGRVDALVDSLRAVPRTGSAAHDPARLKGGRPIPPRDPPVAVLHRRGG